jgi:hypothetical protein
VPACTPMALPTNASMTINKSTRLSLLVSFMFLPSHPSKGIPSMLATGV